MRKNMIYYICERFPELFYDFSQCLTERHFLNGYRYTKGKKVCIKSVDVEEQW